MKNPLARKKNELMQIKNPLAHKKNALYQKIWDFFMLKNLFL